jgi:hypothetical protein
MIMKMSISWDITLCSLMKGNLDSWEQIASVSGLKNMPWEKISMKQVVTRLSDSSKKVGSDTNTKKTLVYVHVPSDYRTKS